MFTVRWVEALKNKIKYLGSPGAEEQTNKESTYTPVTLCSKWNDVKKTHHQGEPQLSLLQQNKRINYKSQGPNHNNPKQRKNRKPQISKGKEKKYRNNRQ